MPARAAVAIAVAVLAAGARAQVQAPPRGGSAALELALRRLETTATVMITNAHPDDEDNALIAMLAHGAGVRVVEATATRGEGGQNDLGPELGLPLSVIRTEELLAAHSIDGAEQVFGRAIDFGYSFSVEETYEKWGKDEILADYVRLVRTIRPDVIISMSPDGGGGGQHHQASARITREAYDAAADPERYPDQIAGGLRPWRAVRLYVPIAVPRPADVDADSRAAESRPESAPATRPGDVTVDVDAFDPALGATYLEVGTLARGMHKTQGMARVGSLPGPAPRRLRVAAGARHGSDPAPPASPAARLARDLGLSTGLAGGATLRMLVASARAALATRGPAAAVAPLVAGLESVRRMRAQAQAQASVGADGDLGFDVGHRLGRLEAEIVRAVAIAAAVRVEALADRATAVPGQEIGVSVFFATRAGEGFTFQRVTFEGFEPAEGGCATRPSRALEAGGLVRCESTLRVPRDAAITSAHWRPVPGAARNEVDASAPFGAPFLPTPFRATVHVSHGGVPIAFEVPVEHRDGSDPIAGEKRQEILVVPPDGSRQDVLRLEYGHTRRRHLVPAPAAPPPPEGVAIAGPRMVGCVPSVSDRVERHVRTLGAEAVVLDDAAFESGDLGRYPVILVASRALELDGRLRRHARTLVSYAEGGGVVVILYQRSGLTEASGAPYPAKTGGHRTTDETAPVTILVPDHPVFNVPNGIAEADWRGWVSERGRSYLETKDPRYVDLVETEDPFEFNPGRKRGILVEARVGAGRWIYVGLSLSRQLEAGNPGAFRILANLLSLDGEPRAR